MLNVVETFSGIGSQAKALKNIKADFSIKAIVEWEVSAIYAYDLIHNGPQDLTPLANSSKEELIDKMKNFNLSSDGKNLMNYNSLRRMTLEQLKSLYMAIQRTNNLIDITQVKAMDLPENIDLLTYSFPCQDLSVSSFWHNNMSGIDRDADNRSGLLWQIERILKEYVEIDKKKPNFLLMENVSNILSPRHISNFESWKEFLSSLGYNNIVYTLNAKNFGVPQKRVRTYMLSVLTDDYEKDKLLDDYIFHHNLENYSIETRNIAEFLRLDYTKSVYKKEALFSAPNFTESRKKIYNGNQWLVDGNKVKENAIAKTITTKQDRHPNAGLITLNDNKNFPKKKYRNLTPRECFLLMGFSERDFDKLMLSNENNQSKQTYLGHGKLLKLAGNSIVVPVLEKIFEQILEIQKNILEK